MAGIKGLNFDENATCCIRNIFDGKNFSDWGIFCPITDANADNLQDNIVCEFFGNHWDRFSDRENWEYFVNSFPQNECRYALGNFRYHSPEDNTVRCKMIFVMWAPDSAPVKEKLSCAMHNLDVKSQIQTIGGIHLSFQANSLEDISFDAVVEKIKRVCSVF